MPENVENKALSPMIVLRGIDAGPLRKIDLSIPLSRITFLAGPSGIGKSLIARGIIVGSSLRALSVGLNAARIERELRYPAVNVATIAGLPAAIDVNSHVESMCLGETVAQTIGVLHPFLSLAVSQGMPRCGHCSGVCSGEQIDVAVSRILLALREQHSSGCRIGICPWYSIREFDGTASDLWSAANTLFVLGYRRFIISGKILKVEGDTLPKDLFAELKQQRVSVPPIHGEESQALFEPPGFGVVTRVLSPGLPGDGATEINQAIEEAQGLSGGQVILALLAPDGSVKHRILCGERFVCEVCGRKGLPMDLSSRISAALSNPCLACGASIPFRGRAAASSMCSECLNTGLSLEALAVDWRGLSVREWLAKPLGALCRRSSESVEGEALSPDMIGGCARDQLAVINSVASQLGLESLPVGRLVSDLSSGERLKLATARLLLAELSETLLVYDSIDRVLHPDDLAMLLETGLRFLEFGNSLLLTASTAISPTKDIEVIRLEWSQDKKSAVVCPYGDTTLAGLRCSEPASALIPPRRSPRIRERGRFELPGGGAGFSIPLGALCAVTGPSGSGKTRLLEQLELNYSPKKLQPRGIAQFAVVVREGIVSAKIPLSRSRTVAKEVALDLLLARFFCELPSARQLGLTANHFSLSHQLGRCSGCDGLGLREVYLETVGTIYEDCELCFGQGFSPIVGNILYDGYTISELYGLGAKELSGVFRSSAEIIAICSSLESVGLGEIALSRRINLLSQSERQRLLLARVFMKRAKGDALLLLEQPLDDLSLEDLDDVLSWLREARGTATTAVFTTLSADVVLRCDHAIALSRSGVIVYNGDPLERGVAYWGEHHYSLPLPS